MIDATDLTTTEVRTQYVQPLIKQILAKTNLNAATLGIKAEPDESPEKVGEESVIGTLYQEIDLYKGEVLESNDFNSSARANNKSYAEILEEASALSAYLTREEQTLVATVASSTFVSFLIPQCDYLNFLHSYYVPSTSGTASSSNETSAQIIGTLEERLTNAMIWSQDSTIKGGSAFPYSASRMRSTGDDNDDGFTTAYFYRFLSQGLASYLSCGMVSCSNKAVIRKQACNDMIQLISMAICPVAPHNNLKSKSEAGASSVEEASLLPLSFQLSHTDRLQILRVCKQLKMPSNAAANDQALAQLRESLFGFATYVAHSDEEAATANKALVNASLNEEDESVIQTVFQRLLQTLVESMSSCIIDSTGCCIQEMILKYKGNKTKLYLFALRLLAKHFNEEIHSAKNTNKTWSNESTSDEENVAKRQKRSPGNCKSFRLTAILKAMGVLFSTGGGLQSSSKRDTDFQVDATIKQVIQNATILLQCSADDQLLVQSASDFLVLALSYETSYLTDKSNVKHIFIHVRKSLVSVKDDEVSDAIIDALKPLIVMCSRQSGTFAISFLSFVIKTFSAQQKVLWKLATYVSIGNPLAASKRLSNLSEGSSDDSIATCKIRAILSSGGASASDTTLQHCLSLAGSINDMWVLFKLVRVAFQTNKYAFARVILEKRLVCGCSRQQSFMYINALSKLARSEEVLAMKGAKGVAESLELLSSCNSMFTSLAALERNSKFDFQLEFIRLRLDTLNLITITRSLSVEILMTEGTLSSKNNRSTLFRNNIGKSFGLLVSRYEKMYRLWGLHRCQQTRSTLRTLQAICQLLSEFTKLGTKEAKNSTVTAASTSTSKSMTPIYDQNQSMNITLSKLRNDVLTQMKKPKQNSVSLASGLVLVLDAILKCPSPFPSGFFQMKPIPRAIVNISADPNLLTKTLTQNGDHDITVDAKSRAEIIDVVPGLATTVILSGWLPENFIQSADVAISEIIAWANLHYEGQLYEEDDAVDSDAGVGNGMTLRVDLDGGETTGSASLLAAGKFIMPLTFEPLLQDGYYKVNIDLGCRDVRGGEWKIPTSSPLEVIFRVDDDGIV